MWQFIRPNIMARLVSLLVPGVVFLLSAITPARGQTGFSVPAPLNADAASDTRMDYSVETAAGKNGRWIAVWQAHQGAGTDFDIYVARSDGQGHTWSNPTVLHANASTDTGNDLRPKIGTDGNGTWIVVWESTENLAGTAGADSDILVTRSVDDGLTWSAPALLNQNGNSDVGWDETPSVSTDKQGRWIAVWTSTSDLGGSIGSDQDILYANSADQGLTWSAPRALNTTAPTDDASDSAPDIATDGQGRWIVSWASHNEASDILVATSSDFGEHWSSPRGLHVTNIVETGRDFVPLIRTSGTGAWLVVWESGVSLNSIIDSDQDILFSRSADGGQTWSAPAPLNSYANTGYELDANPAIATDGRGLWVALWESERDLAGNGKEGDVLAAVSTDDGATWSQAGLLIPAAAIDTAADHSPYIATDGAGQWLACFDSTQNLAGSVSGDSDLFVTTATFGPVSKALNSNASKDAGADFDNRLATDGAGNWVTIWRSHENLNGAAGFDADIFVSYSSDDARTWSDPAILNSYANTDNDFDLNPVLRTDRAGTWLALWDSPFNLNGTIGTDQDILISRSTDNGRTWSPAAALNTNATTDDASDITPSLATDGRGRWMAVWQSNNTLGSTIGSDTDILFSVSTDNGLTWSSPRVLNGNAAIDQGEDFDPTVVSDGANRWIVAWMSNDSLGNTIGGDDDLLFQVSDDLGATWSNPGPLNSNATTDEADDFFPQLATDGSGHWVAVWHQQKALNSPFGPDGDILFARSNDNGSTWKPLAALYTAAVNDQKEDNFARVSVNRQGQWFVTWNSDKQVVYTLSDDSGQTWASPSLLDSVAAFVGTHMSSAYAAADSNGRWVAAWSGLASGVTSDWDLSYSRIGNGNGSPDANAGSPTLTRFVVSADQVFLQWTGSVGPCIVLHQGDLADLPWQVVAITESNSVVLPKTRETGFFKLADGKSYLWGYPKGYPFGANGTVDHPNGFDGWPSLHPDNPQPGIAGPGGDAFPGVDGNGGNGGIGYKTNGGDGGDASGNGGGGKGGTVFATGNGGNGGNGGLNGGAGGAGGNADVMGNGGKGGDSTGLNGKGGKGGNGGKQGGDGGNGGNAGGQNGRGGNGGNAPAGAGGTGGQGAPDGDGADGQSGEARLKPNLVDDGLRSMICNEVHVVAALNDDDDDQNDQPDHAGAPSPMEDNYAQLAFDAPGSGFVSVAAPQFVTGTLGDALGTRVRAYMDRNGTAFPFGQRLPTGQGPNALILYLEGISVSDKIDEIIFEYNYDDPNGLGLCSGYTYVTVMRIETERDMSNNTDRTRLREHAKLFRESEMTAKARVFPTELEQKVQYQQEHRRGRFADRGFRDGWHHWRYTADSLHTWFRDKNQEPTTVTVTPDFAPSSVIRVEQPLNVTVPHLLHHDSTENGTVPAGAAASQAGNTEIWVTELFNPQRPAVLLFNRRVNYTIQDQFGDPIVESARDGGTVVIREDVPLTSPASNTLQTWLDTMVANNTSVDWRAPANEGELRDRTTIQVPVNTFTRNPGPQFVVGVGADLITMRAHVWHLGIRRGNSTVDTRSATYNPLRVYVDSTENGSIRLRSEYIVFTWGPQ